jgi:hypothetical protein
MSTTRGVAAYAAVQASGSGPSRHIAVPREFGRRIAEVEGWTGAATVSENRPDPLVLGPEGRVI